MKYVILLVVGRNCYGFGSSGKGMDTVHTRFDVLQFRTFSRWQFVVLSLGVNTVDSAIPVRFITKAVVALLSD